MSQSNILLEMTTQIVSSYVRANHIEKSQLPELTKEVYESLLELNQQSGSTSGESLVPAVPVDESITKDYLICLEDGKPFKSLKRHLKAKYNMEPDDYRQKWGLPTDYPMVAPSYSRRRSRLARDSKLGHKK